jgi:hypothetical protein
LNITLLIIQIISNDKEIMRHILAFLLPFLLGFLLGYCKKNVARVSMVNSIHAGRPRDPWKPATICDDEDVPPYNFVMTRTDSGHSVTWTWNE